MSDKNTALMDFAYLADLVEGVPVARECDDGVAREHIIEAIELVMKETIIVERPFQRYPSLIQIYEIALRLSRERLIPTDTVNQ